MAARPTPEMLAPCPDAPARPAGADGGSTGGQMMSWALDLLDVYGQCRARHAALAEAVGVAIEETPR